MSQGRLGLRTFVAAIVTTMGLGFAPVAAHAAGPPTVVVTPSTNLVSGQILQVKGSGFDASSEVLGFECARDASDLSRCDFGTIASVQTDAHGRFKTQLIAHRTLFTVDGLIDCAPSACELLFRGAADPAVQAAAPIDFDPSAPLPPTSMKVNPATNLLHLQSALVTGKGFTPGAKLEVTECVVATFACGPLDETTVAANGHLSTHFSVRRVVYDGVATRVDCAGSPGTCEMLVFEFTNADYHATASLAFDASVSPPPRPTFKADPKHDLPFYARVNVTGTLWSPGDSAIVLQCSARTGRMCAEIGAAAIDGNGNMTAAPLVRRFLPDLFNPGGPSVDCAAPGADCVVAVQDIDDGAFNAEPLTFDPNAPIPPPPGASIKPTGPYLDNQKVHVKGHDFPPTSAFDVAECVVQDGTRSCSSTGGGTGTTTATGSFTSPFQLQRQFASFDGSTIDCAAVGVDCFLEVNSEGGVVVDLPLTFTTSGAADAA